MINGEREYSYAIACYPPMIEILVFQISGVMKDWRGGRNISGINGGPHVNKTGNQCSLYTSLWNMRITHKLFHCHHKSRQHEGRQYGREKE